MRGPPTRRGLTAAVVLRPEPGNARTAARLAAAGVPTRCEPLFAVVPLAWAPPDPAAFDALLLTSANAVRHAGAGLTSIRHLPVFAVGTATAHAARAAGLSVAYVGEEDAAALAAAARARGHCRLLHLAGRERVALPGIHAIPVYASDPLPIEPGAARGWEGKLLLLHSARAAKRAAALVGESGAERARIAIAALSPQVLRAAGEGWARAEAAARPSDAALVALAAALIDRSGADGDKAG